MKELAALLGKMRKTAYDTACFHDQAMCAAIGMNMHGFKRWHRCASRCAYDSGLHLANDFGNYAGGETPGMPEYHTQALGTGPQAHIDGCIAFLDAKVLELGKLNGDFFSLSGTNLPCAEKLQGEIFHNLVKLRRWKQRFEDNKWMPHDLYMFDAALHAKMKGKEKDFFEE